MAILVRRFELAMAFLIFAASTLAAQDSPEALLTEAESIYEGPESSLTTLSAVRALLDRIVNEHPSSDLAVSVLLAEPVGEIDVAGLNARLQDRDLPESSAIETPAENEPTDSRTTDTPKVGTGSPSSLTPGSETSESALGLDKQDIRDLQARLLVLGHDPNGVDGVIGRGTRSALSAWQVAQGAEATGYLSADQHARLKAMSEAALAAWRSDPNNERKYLPPPPISLGPRNMAGNWRYTTNCGSGSRLGRMKITGVLAMRHAGGNNYNGTLSNSQGLRGRVSASLRGRSVSAVTNFGLLIGKVSLRARVDDQQLVLRGQDSNGCSFFATKS